MEASTPAPAPAPEVLIPAVRAAERIGITRRSLARWLKIESLNFPEPLTINGRLYIREVEFNSWLADRARLSVAKAA